MKTHLDELTKRLKTQGYDIDFDAKAINLLAAKGFDPEYGARPVRRVIQERVEDEIAEHILKGVFHPGDTIRVIRKDEETIDLMHGDKKKIKAEALEEVEEEAEATL